MYGSLTKIKRYDMSITIKRNTGWIGSAAKIQIKLNGDKVASVNENQQVEVKLPNDKAYIKATQFEIKSNEIEVKDGDIVEITSKKWYQMSLPVIIFVIFSMNFISNSTYRIAALISVCVLYIISILLMDGFYLRVIDRWQQ
jgi:translation initiation factor IF-1